jgi:hypothetical protein
MHPAQDELHDGSPQAQNMSTKIPIAMKIQIGCDTDLATYTLDSSQLLAGLLQ